MEQYSLTTFLLTSPVYYLVTPHSLLCYGVLTVTAPKHALDYFISIRLFITQLCLYLSLCLRYLYLHMHHLVFDLDVNRS